MSTKREAAGLEPQQSVTEPELVKLRLYAIQSGSGWTCVRAVSGHTCTICQAVSTHHWIGALPGAQTWRCAVHPPWGKEQPSYDYR